MIYEDGRTYKGEYLYDEKHGHGIYTWPNGKMYEGGWIKGKQHGRAKFTNASGAQRLGEWEKGKRIKWIKPDGTTEESGSVFNQSDLISSGSRMKITSPFKEGIRKSGS